VKALAIMYHDVVEGDLESSGFPGAGANVYKLERADFARHLDAIREAAGGGQLETIEGRGDWGRRQPVLLTFDDGGVSAHEIVAAMLEERGWRGHFFITTDWIGRPGFLNEAQIRELRRRGHVVGSHSASHPARMSHVSWEQMQREWRSSTQALAQILGEPVKVASVPGGYYSRRVSEAAALAGIEALFTSEPTNRARESGGCLVLGRYVVRRGMGPEWSGGFAAGRLAPRWKQTAFWTAKRSAKALGGEAYLRLRERLLRISGRNQP
jgi:peptidoglycan/xylan/chitin deacetylase (PgdA/CDA1 family)